MRSSRRSAWRTAGLTLNLYCRRPGLLSGVALTAPFCDYDRGGLDSLAEHPPTWGLAFSWKARTADKSREYGEFRACRGPSAWGPRVLA